MRRKRITRVAGGAPPFSAGPLITGACPEELAGLAGQLKELVARFKV
jgi:hypothetical protein